MDELHDVAECGNMACRCFTLRHAFHYANALHSQERLDGYISPRRSIVHQSRASLGESSTPPPPVPLPGGLGVTSDSS